MKMIITGIAAVAAISVAAPVFAADAKTATEASMETKANGGYTKAAKSETENAKGNVSSSSKVDLTVDSDGNRKKVTTTEKVVDPNGLYNKDTVKTETTEKLQDGKLSVESEKTVNGKTVNEMKKAY